MFLTPLTRQPVQKSRNNLTDFHSWIDEFFNDNVFAPTSQGTFKLDVKETEKEYTVIADLPGVTKEEIFIDYQNDLLSIAVKREEQTKDEQNNFVYRERKMASMQRSLTIPNINAEKISAKLKDGMLEISAPKMNGEKPKINIEVK